MGQAAMAEELTGAIFLVMFTNENEATFRHCPLKARAMLFTTRALVEGRTVRSADIDRFTFQYKTNSRKGSLVKSSRSNLQQQAGLRLASRFSWQTNVPAHCDFQFL